MPVRMSFCSWPRHLSTIVQHPLIIRGSFFSFFTGPNQAVDESVTADFFKGLGKKWTSLSDPAPSSILVISGHWEGERGIVRVRTSEENQLYYDFYGFPDFMYKLQYPSKGSPKLANRVLQVLDEVKLCPSSSSFLLSDLAPSNTSSDSLIGGHPSKSRDKARRGSWRMGTLLAHPTQARDPHCTNVTSRDAWKASRGSI